MNKIAEYNGRLLNHVEAVYRPGERELAIELVQALGCAVSDTGFRSDPDSPTFLAVHPEPTDCNGANNVFYVSEMTLEHQALDKRLNELVVEDSALATIVRDYHDKAISRPMGISHFAIRYTSFAEVQAVDKRMKELALKLRGRLFNIELAKPSSAAEPKVTQSFLYQDIIVSGPSALGQLIELQSQIQP